MIKSFSCNQLLAGPERYLQRHAVSTTRLQCYRPQDWQVASASQLTFHATETLLKAWFKAFAKLTSKNCSQCLRRSNVFHVIKGRTLHNGSCIGKMPVKTMVSIKTEMILWMRAEVILWMRVEFIWIIKTAMMQLIEASPRLLIEATQGC